MLLRLPASKPTPCSLTGSPAARLRGPRRCGFTVRSQKVLPEYGELLGRLREPRTSALGARLALCMPGQLCPNNVSSTSSQRMCPVKVRFLNTRCLIAGNADAVIDSARQLSAGSAGQTYCDESLLAGCVHGSQHIGGVSAGADGEGDVIGTAHPLDLAREHVVKGIIVADGG